MPYRVRRGSGSRPFQIINISTGKVVGTSTSRANAAGSISHRMDAESKTKDVKQYKRTVDNKMHMYGETDLGKKTIRINKKLSKKDPMHKRKLHKNASAYPEVLDTIVHERKHVEHPKMHENTVRKLTKQSIKKMSKKQKGKNYALFT